MERIEEEWKKLVFKWEIREKWGWRLKQIEVDFILWVKMCGPCIFSMMHSHSNGETRFFIYLMKNMIFRKDLESPLIFVLFLKIKQNKKENPKCDSLFGKISLWKTESSPEIKLPIRKVWWWAVASL